MGFYGNITNTSRTQFQFDLVYPSRNAMENGCAKDGVYVGRYVLVDYDRDPNNQFKIGYRKGKLIDFKEDGDFLYSSKNLEEISKINYIEDEYWDYENNTTDIIKGVTEGIVVKVKETETQYKEYNEEGKPTSTKDDNILIEVGEYSLFICIGKVTVEEEELDGTGKPIIVIKNYALFKKQLEDESESNYIVNYNKDKDYYKTENIGRGWDSTVWQKVYENGLEKYVMIAELNSVVPTFDIQADAPSMSPVTPHFDENSTNVYYKLHWQPQWGMRTRAAAGDLQTSQIDRNGEVLEKPNIYTSSSVDLGKSPAETYPSDVNTKWEKYEYNPSAGLQEKYVYTVKDGVGEWKKSVDVEGEEETKIPAAIYWNEAGFDSKVISDTTLHPDEVLNAEWDGKTDFISIKPTGWSGHQYSSHDGFKEMKPAPDTQEMMVMLPSIGNAISKVWDIMYGGVDTNDNIKATLERNKNINWENPEKNIERKGLRLIHDKYLPITEGEMIDGYKPYVYYKWNSIIKDYELITDKEIPKDITIFTRSGAGQTFDPKEAGTIAGAINSIHDLMGMIIVDQDPSDDPNGAPLNTISSDRIYYYPIDGTYRIKDFEYKYNELDDDIYFTYQSAKDYYIDLYNITDEEERKSFKLTEKEFAPEMFYIKSEGNSYIKVAKDATFVEGVDYFVKKLNVNENSIFDKINLDTFTSGWYKSSTGSYIYKDGGTIDDGVIYYNINEYKLIDHKYIPDGEVNSTNFQEKVEQGIFKNINGVYVKVKEIDEFDSSNPYYYKEDLNYVQQWPHVFVDGEIYEKNSFYYKNQDNSYTLMDLDICDKNKKPFYKIPQEICSEVHPFVYSIDDINRYDSKLIEEPIEEELKENWSGPYSPEEGYWNKETEEIVYGNVYPTYFYTPNVYYRKCIENNEEDLKQYDIQFNGVKYRILDAGIPTDGFGYLFDRPRTNADVPGDDKAAYGNPESVYKVKLIDFNNQEKEKLYYAKETEYYEKNVLDEDGNLVKDENGKDKTEQAIRTIVWMPVTKENIDEWYKELGLRKGLNKEIDVFKPKEQIYFFEIKEGVQDLYEPNRYFYKKLNENNEPSYIKDTELKFTPEMPYYDSKYFTIGKDKDIYAITPLGDSGEYYMPNKYYYFDSSKQQYVIDTSLTPRNKTQYYKRNDIYISEDTSGFFQKGASWNMSAEAIPHTVTLSKREEIGYMKELKSFGRSYNTINGLILQLNRLMAVDKPDTRDRSTLQGAINYLNDMVIKIHSLTPGDLPLIDSYGRLHGGNIETDEWIDVKIDPNVEQPRMIVTHEHNPDDITDSSRDLNGDKIDDAPELFNVGDNDTITFPTYKFDNMGHQVNTQPTLHTITLPYGFKTIKATNTEDDAVNGPAIKIKEEGQIADNTQDTLTFSASNRWIKFDNNTEDTVKVGHLLSPFIDETAPNKLYGLTQDEDHTKSTNDLGDLDKDNTFEVPCFQFDEAGHILEARTHTVTLPEIYNKFIVSAETAEVANMDYVAGTITADNMNDTVTFTPGNKWIHMAVSGTNDEDTLDTDVIKIAHEVTAFDDGEANKEYGLLADETISDANNSFEIPAFKFDEAGHIRGARTHTLTLPFGFTKFAKAVHTTIDNVDKTEGSAIITVEPDTMTDTITFGNGNKWICVDANAENDSFTFSHYVKDFVESSATTDLNTEGTFTVQELGWDRAGHLTSSNKRTYTLPYNFKTIEVTGTSNVVENSISGTNGTIIADTHIDTLTLTPGNKWIQLVGNADNDTVTFKHYVNKFTETTAITDNNTLANNTISTQELTWDEAGHLIGSNKRTYTLPYNFKTFTILNEGNGVTEAGVATNGKLIAEDQIDEITLTSGNRWITMIADTSGRKATIAHAVAGTASTSKGDTANQTPAFGSTFKVLSAGIDQTGHVSSLEEHTVQIPLASLNNETVGGVDSVLTKLSLEPTTGAFTTEHKNVGDLLITGYSVASDLETIVETDSINNAFGKVQKALDILNADEANENSINYKIKNAVDGLRSELEAECDEEFKNFKLIQEQISDGNEETIINRVKALEEKSLPEYKGLENDEVYLIKMVNGEPTWISLASWNGGKY